jgi:D-alanyl-lipoteichoic acid acyltransferase DltB (MBOAT superfamily)
MTFTEQPFWILTAVTFVLWLLCRRHYAAKVVLLLTASVVFYGYRHWPLLFLMLAYCVVDWAAARWVARARRPGLPLALGVTFNLVVLAYWKYTPLLLRTAAALLPLHVPDPPQDWVIPFGISFYAFTGIAYLVDVYRGTTPAETSFWRYALSAMFFPHLVAGPILRPGEFLEKLRPGAMPERPEAPLEALHLLGLGLFKKLVIADRIALAIDPFFVHVADGSTAGVWALPYAYLYALQIYFDFSGYTDIARGLGLMFGFRWPDNFNAPYLATSVKDFWRRWHMSLSLFLKDYLYVPLGGNRHGRWRTHLNLMATMLLGGLWHGASWSFMIWGGLHGLYLVVNGLWSACPLAGRLRALPGPAGVAWRLLCVALTFHAVCLAWCFFRLSVFAESVVCVQKWVVFDADKVFVGGSADVSLWLLLAAYVVLTVAARQCGRLVPALANWELPPQRAPLARGFLWGAGAAVLVLALLLAPAGEKPPFIYFQF